MPYIPIFGAVGSILVDLGLSLIPPLIRKTSTLAAPDRMPDIRSSRGILTFWAVFCDVFSPQPKEIKITIRRRIRDCFIVELSSSFIGLARLLTDRIPSSCVSVI
jgi:hypothetical protein